MDQPRPDRSKTITGSNTYTTWKGEQLYRQQHPDQFRLRSTGLAALDRILGGGLEFGQLVLYGGEQKIGKSTLLQITAQEFGRRKDPFAFFSMEMTSHQLISRIVCNISGLDKNKVRRIEMDAYDWTMADLAGREIDGYPATWIFNNRKIEAIRTILENNPDIWTVFVDHFGLFEIPARVNRYEAMTNNSHELKQMALGTGLPHQTLMIVATQLNRTSIRSGHRDANAYQGTSAQEQDMDIGIIVESAMDVEGKNKLPGYRNLIVVGSRDTDIGHCRVQFNGSTSTLRDMEDEPRKVDLKHWQGR